MTNLRAVVLALLVPCCPARAWLPDAGELEALCRLSQWEEQAAPLLAEPDHVIQGWLASPISILEDTPLHICALHGSTGLLVKLLSRVPESDWLVLECRDVWGNTPLHLAAMNGHLSVMQCLLAHGAMVGAKTSGGTTPLHRAAMCGHLPVVQCLLAHGAAVDAVTSDGTTSLHWAALNGHLPVMQCLLAHGAGADTVNSFGTTPLHWATLNGHQNAARLLRNPPGPNFTPQSLQHLLSFRIWRSVGRHIDRLRAMFNDPAYPLPPGLLTAILADLGFRSLRPDVL